jgi:TetR/AcrR family transcriptional regulator, transcriptional repressor for nem operon
VGALQLARAVNDKRLSQEILQSGADEAIALAGQIGKKE